MTRRILALVRPKLLDAGEMDALHALAERLGPERFALTVSRLDVRAGDLVVARHTAWPWPLELALDVRRLGGALLNGPNAYHYADDARQWSADLGDLTPRTWDRFEELPADTAFVLKGKKADKRAWRRMFAPDKAHAIALRAELQRDLAFADDTIVARAYVPLERLGTSLGDVPISVEYRVFVGEGVELSRGFYWPAEDCDRPPPAPDVIPADFLRAAMARVGDRIRFYALDVARDTAGRWWVVELNDGQRSGMSANDPARVWARLVETVTGS